MSRTYLDRAWKSFDGSNEVTRFFESLDPKEWEELIRDLLSEAPEARQVFTPRDSDMLSYAATLIGQDDRSASCLLRVQEALSRIFNEEIRHPSPSKKRFDDLRFLVECLGLSLRVQNDDVGFELEPSG